MSAFPASASPHALFTPLKVGNVELQHRIALAPLTRFRAGDDHVPTDLMVEYYGQRASTPGTLLITEATFIAQKAGGYDNVPGIWNSDQIQGWKKVTDEVHKHGSFVFLQLWALGRQATPAVLEKEALKAGQAPESFPYVSASNIKLPEKGRDHDYAPRPLTIAEIDEYVELYAQAADNAITAGFDGVEVHSANSYLLDQFLQTNSNHRVDEYGGSVEARAKFALRVIEAVSDRVGPSRTALRISPWNNYGGMRMEDPIPTFTYFVEELRKHHPDIAYLHGVEGVKGSSDQLDFVREIWKGGEGGKNRVFLSCGGHDRESALIYAKERGDVVVFGRWFISNPDLPRRLKDNIKLTPYDYSSFYLPQDPKGYTDYPFATENVSGLDGLKTSDYPSAPVHS